ncbi:hypothetical protein BS78_04G048300 [Paspalum vaginatum]|nr:hypothetical protein BS78_04G048300 [Paspalum vaginatum]
MASPATRISASAATHGLSSDPTASCGPAQPSPSGVSPPVYGSSGAASPRPAASGAAPPVCRSLLPLALGSFGAASPWPAASGVFTARLPQPPMRGRRRKSWGLRPEGRPWAHA